MTKQPFHTSIYSCNPFIRASQTSGTITEINCLEILKRYIKLVYESPVARKRSVTANLSLIGIVSLKFVSLLAIWGPIIVANFSKSLTDILVKFCKPPWSSSRKFNTLLSRYLLLNIALCHHLRLFLLVWQSIFIRIKAAPAIITSWSDITTRGLRFHFYQGNCKRGLWQE